MSDSVPESVSVQTIVRSARRRLNARSFLQSAVWSLTVTLGAAALVLLAGKFTPLPISAVSSVGVGAAIGLLFAAAWTWRHRRGDVEAAVEIDRLFQLRERVSTLLTLEESQRTHPAALALANDVAARTRTLDVSSRLPVGWPKLGWLPIVPACVCLAVYYLVGPLDWLHSAKATTTVAAEREIVAEKTKLLSKKMAERQKEIEDSKLDGDLKELADKIDKAARELSANPKADVKESVLKLSDMAKTLEEKRKQLESLDSVKRNLSKLSRVGEGPGQQLADALKQGDFTQASKQLKELAKKLEDKKLSAPEKKELAKQLSDLKKQLDQLADMKDRAEQLKKSVPPEMLKKELEKLAQDSKQLEQLKQLADKLGQCSKCLGKDGGAAQKELEGALAEAKKIADQMMEEEMRQAKLDEMLDDLGECRGGMCKGEGRRDNARGKGRGEGDREEAEDKTRSRDTRVRTKISRGPATIVGRTSGKNFKGESRLELRAEAATAARAADEAVTRQKIPAEYRDHTRDYFQNLSGSLKD